MKRKLNFEMIPDGCWKYNLRTILNKRQWEYIRQDAYIRFQKKCAICGKPLIKFEAHEVWDYDEKNGIIILKDVLCLCSACHKTIHIGHTALTNFYIQAQNHYMKVNDVSYAEMIKDMGKANEVQKRRSLVPEWKMNLEWLRRFVND